MPSRDAPRGAATIIADALRDAAGRGFDRGRTMPRAFYTDPGFLALEMEHLFRKEWHCVGRVEEVATPGQFMATRLADEALVIVHGEDGRIRALSNVCRHRGTLIAKDKGKVRRLLCPYHHWAYDLEGRLTAAPRIPPRDDFQPDRCRLPAFPCETWMGFIFVSLDPEAMSLAPRLADLDARIAPYHLEDMRLGYLSDEVWDTNWKSLVENYMEAYHLTPLHRGTLSQLNPTELAQQLVVGEAWYGYEVGFPPQAPRVTRGHPELTKAQADTCVMIMVGPGSGIGLAADYSSFLCVQPEGVDKVRLKSGVLFWGDAWTPETTQRAVELFQATMAEDRSVLEPLMIGYRSARHETGPLAPGALEGPILALAQSIGRRLLPVLARDLQASRIPHKGARHG